MLLMILLVRSLPFLSGSPSILSRGARLASAFIGRIGDAAHSHRHGDAGQRLSMVFSVEGFLWLAIHLLPPESYLCHARKGWITRRKAFLYLGGICKDESISES